MSHLIIYEVKLQIISLWYLLYESNSFGSKKLKIYY